MKFKKIIINGKIALVDNEDFPVISRHDWTLNSEGYAYTILAAVRVYMHKIIFPISKKFVVDHINFNRIDNRKSNLQQLPNVDNLNKREFTHTGVSYHGASRKWRARAYVDKKEKYLGIFKNKKDALNAVSNFKKG